MFKRILFPTDGSEQANNALNYVSELAKKFDSQVIVLHTYNFPLAEYIPFNVDTSKINQSVLKECNQILLDNHTKLKESGIKVSSLLKEGPAGFMIISTAEQEGCDLIVMGSRVNSGVVKSVLIGSASNYVVHHAKCPVFLTH